MKLNNLGMSTGWKADDKKQGPEQYRHAACPMCIACHTIRREPEVTPLNASVKRKSRFPAPVPFVVTCAGIIAALYYGHDGEADVF